MLVQFFFNIHRHTLNINICGGAEDEDDGVDTDSGTDSDEDDSESFLSDDETISRSRNSTCIGRYKGPEPKYIEKIQMNLRSSDKDGRGISTV